MSSKKDLLERINRAPSAEPRPTVIRRPEEPDPRIPVGDPTTTRVSTNIVRRRAADVKEEAPVVVRRRAVDLAPPVAPRAAPPRVEPEPQREAEPSVASLPDEPAPEVVVAAASVEAPAVEAERVASAEPAVEPAVVAVAVREPEPEEIRPRPMVSRPVTQAPPPPRPPEPERRVLPPRPETGEAPRYAGLGKAVVMPPPGYDPTNPSTWRREPPRPTGGPGPRGPGGGGGPGSPASTDPARGRRRMETAEPQSVQNRGRRQPAVPGRAAAVESPFRPGQKRKVVAGKGAPPPKAAGPKAAKRKVRIDNAISVGQLAHELGVKAAVVIRQLMGLGKMATITELLDLDTAALVASEFDYEVENVGFQEETYLPTAVKAEDEVGLAPRPAVVAVMGHVDHGKTTLLDAIRSARVAAGEAGGITQHIGAYQVEKRGQKITFLDTPGHEAFSAMRARGAGVTDIVVLVVAADDGVQPQTEEALAHAKAAGVPVIVAVNKMDKAGANPDFVKQRLSEKDLVPEDWGGDTMYVPVSALRQQGIDELLEAVLLQAEVLDLKANPDRHAEGTVIEAKMERGRGPVATVLVQKGTLHRGDFVVLGSSFGKVRAVVDHTGTRLKDAPPSTPVELFGLSELPEVGDKMVVVENEKNARALAEHRAQEKRELAMANTRRRTAEDLFAQGREVATERVLLVLKADVQGSLEALKTAINNLDVAGAEVRILHAAVGDVSESDVNMATADDALLVAFNVGIDTRARQAAQEQGVEVEQYSVIYDLLNRVERQLKGMLAPTYHSVRQGSAEVRQLFRISKVGTVAGSYVLDGKIGRNHTVKVLRGGSVVWEGKLSALKRFKDDVREVAAGYECGISLDGFDAVESGDVIEFYVQEQVAV